MTYDVEGQGLLAKFQNIGLAKEDVNGLLEDVKNALANGTLSPLLQLNIKSGENTFQLPAKIRIGIDPTTNQPELFIYGVNKESLNHGMVSSMMYMEMRKGEVLHLNNAGENLYLQYDPETKNIVRLKGDDLKLEERLKSVEKVLDIELGKEQKERILEGKPVKLDVGGEDVTVGIDLRSPNMFKQLKGDMNEWQRQKEIEYDIAHPEYLGLVKTDQNRWEYHMIQTQGKNSQKLKEAPAQTKSAGMKM